MLRICYIIEVFAEHFQWNRDLIKRVSSTELSGDIVQVSDKFTFNSPILECEDGKITTIDTIPIFEKPTPLKDILESEIDEKYILDDQKFKFKYLRGGKKIERVSKDGYKYTYSEGGMSDETPRFARKNNVSRGL